MKDVENCENDVDCRVCVYVCRSNGTIPPCFFTKAQLEQSKDISIQRFVQLNHKCLCGGHNA